MHTLACKFQARYINKRSHLCMTLAVVECKTLAHQKQLKFCGPVAVRESVKPCYNSNMSVKESAVKRSNPPPPPPPPKKKKTKTKKQKKKQKKTKKTFVEISFAAFESCSGHFDLQLLTYLLSLFVVTAGVPMKISTMLCGM